MEHIKMAISEEKNAIVYKWSLGYENRGHELEWVSNVATSRRTGDKWSFEFHNTAPLDQNQFDVYRKLLEKINQVAETNASNLMGITVDRSKPIETPVAASKAK
jgi:hypothetical protein